MLEIRQYKISEIREILGTRDRQGIRKKLQRYGIDFEETGRGERVIFNILSVPDSFKLFCIIELNIPAQADFERMKLFYYLFFEDENFINMSDVDKENYMSDNYVRVSRLTIRNWVKYLERAELIHRDMNNCKYQAVIHNADGKKSTIEISQETYKAGWREYWKHNIPEESKKAFDKAIEIWGGVACRIPNIVINAIEWEKTKTFKEIIINSMFEEQYFIFEILFFHFKLISPYRFSYIYEGITYSHKAAERRCSE